ncbi:hypothetical protein MACJ_002487 [Theileria orientalis]|uniref:Uncharacterized protein n=1 Tax=Theileria orientalis TaxID=68886 RepID=A0A976M697_THEOR|nr:hypothetical protein MACJ_002487 [Theileria orientalis]
MYRPIFSRGNDVKTTSTKELYDKFSIFEVVKYEIEYPRLEESISQTTSSPHYDLYIHSGTQSNPGELIYSYYWPGGDENIIIKVDSYYYLSDNHLPLALVFTTDNKKFYSTYDKLLQGRNSRSVPGIPIEDRELCSKLFSDYRSSNKFKTLQLTLISESNEHVDTNERNIGMDNKFKKVIFTPNPKPGESRFLLKSNNLFTHSPEDGLKNEIDQSCLNKIKDKSPNAVIVYYTDSQNKPGNLAILIELLIDSGKIHIKRANTNPPAWIKRDVHYDYDGGLIDQLNIIKGEIESAITYKLEKNKNDETYDSERILVTNGQNHGSGYNIYTHQLRITGELPLLLYNDRQVDPVGNMEISDTDKLKTSDGDPLNQISTYVLSNNDKEHLLIKLTKEDGTNYYLYRYSKDGSQWRQVGLDCLTHAGINVEDLTGTSLSQYLDAVMTGDSGRKLLECIKLQINSIFVILDKKLNYDHSDIEHLVADEKPTTQISDNSIDPKDETDRTNTCAKEGYTVYKHDLTQPVELAKQKLNTSQLYLKFYLNTRKIELHDNKLGTTKQTYLTYSDTNDLYVYFYGHKDPRPLLFCYGGSAYRPNSKEDYESKWVKDENIKKCVCQDNDGKDLLSALIRVVGFLNVVELKQTGDSTEGQKSGTEDPETEGKQVYPYSLQRFNSNDIIIKVTHKNKKCHRVYIHKPDGIDGLSEGYTLGDIKYDSGSTHDNGLKYQSSDPLSTVSAYYHVHDQHHEYPFLVILEFKVNTGSTYEYYKLKEKGKKVWIKMEERFDKDILKKLKSVENLEDGLYDLRTELGIKFDDKKNIMPLFRDDECKEGKINVAVIAGSAVGTAAVVGTGATVGVIVSKNLAAGAAAAAATTIAL